MNKPSVVLITVIATILYGGPVPSQKVISSDGPAVLPETDVYRFNSTHVSAEFEIRVARPLPAFIGTQATEYEVLYVLDGDLFFGLATDVTRLMHQLFGELPATLVVGVGYGTSDGRLVAESRSRDFTPTVDARLVGPDSRFAGFGDPTLPEDQRYGGADRFLDFLLEEVQPLIAEQYPLAKGRSTLFGSSMGGLFASHVLLERPESFDQYVIASPALWWDNHLLVRTMKERPVLAGSGVARVFLGAGSLEEGASIPQLDEWKLISNTRELALGLQARAEPGLDVSFRVFDDETHTSVVGVVLTRGLRTMHGRP